MSERSLGWRSLDPRLEELERVGAIGRDRLLSWLPVGRAALALVGGRELRRLQLPIHLVDAAPDRLVVDRKGPDDALRVDDEGAAHGDAEVLARGILVEHLEIARHFLGDISEEREVELADPSVLAGCTSPGEVSVFRVHAHANNLSTEFLELRVLLVELHNLCRAHKGEIQRIEEYHDPFALELLRAEVHETIAQNRRAAPVWSWLADRKCLGAEHDCSREQQDETHSFPRH
mmetsp:Transcript_21490/g.50932  ORF Transcript_21490/g.50932 Transcript_21490/m.50932 type:complete len:233 (-) Transcript_21490:8-706(-)